MTWIHHGAVLLAIALVAARASSGRAAQNGPSSPANSQVDLIEVPQPDLTGVDAPVKDQIRASQAALAAARSQSDAPRARLTAAFGNLGQIYQAYGFDDAALACYTNASRLDSQPFQWFYFLGYVRQKNGDSEEAARDYQRALTLNPSYNPALLRMGAVELTLDHPEAAKDSFTKAMAQRRSAAALTGLGKVALTEHDYGAAVKDFTEALASEPKASSVHYQLALAYRGLGDLAHAQEQLQARGETEPDIQDSLLDQINLLKGGRLSLVQRGGAAMRESRFADAISAYDQLVRLDPSDPIAYEYLGVALARQGKRDEAFKQYAQALQLDPSSASAHYDIAILLIQERREEEAIAHFRQAVQLDPGLVMAHFQLANLLMRRGKDTDAEGEYEIVVSLDPRNGFARLMQAMAAVHAGSYARARTLLEDAAAALPSDPDIADALARVLAAAPDSAVRDPGRALRIVATLVRNQQGNPLEVGITLAMALAAVGQFQQAAAYQQAVIGQLEASHQDVLARSLRQNLIRYQQGKACQVPWAGDDPIFTPVPGKVELSSEVDATDAHP
ncbi:MAG: tetratricopeptide repeat protein [Terracidiphilus sp.]